MKKSELDDSAEGRSSFSLVEVFVMDSWTLK
jgi:hypothetical protein